ncbi:hypothetical protein F0562_017716 [Nyssa sinensis]|uniref:Secreted protein n=1 Tax=Nyssa sinensis TaxID=561372 RepID=A0A5J4ZFI8_9ASTE|nr:hypothetical protein F0562_017716 [Nyssa sinensis]
MCMFVCVLWWLNRSGVQGNGCTIAELGGRSGSSSAAVIAVCAALARNLRLRKRSSYGDNLRPSNCRGRQPKYSYSERWILVVVDIAEIGIDGGGNGGDTAYSAVAVSSGATSPSLPPDTARLFLVILAWTKLTICRWIDALITLGDGRVLVAPPVAVSELWLTTETQGQAAAIVGGDILLNSEPGPPS